jgi:hypothetical protein
MSNFNWTNIISLNSSQNDAFEELLCQLAKKESFEHKKEFIKVGNPDGGVECYVILENDDEIGFQAKWFLSTPQETQWNQVEHSFKTALKIHPRMITYYIAIPQDRAYPGIPKRTSFMKKWNEKVIKWKQFAKDTYSREIDFVYWGSSEFITRLSKEENAGLKSFFFGDIDLSNKWFKNQNKVAIKDLGARYTPEINIELEILENFDALSRNHRFQKKCDDIYNDFMVSYRNFLGHIYFQNEDIKKLIKQLNEPMTKFEDLYNDIQFSGIQNINDKQMQEFLEDVQVLSYEVSELLNKLNQEEIKEKNITTSHGYRTSTQYDSNIRNFRDYSSYLYELKGLVNSRMLKLANNPFMILDGDAGIGKSHLLADVVNERMKENSNSIFLLGQHFRSEIHPWSQILNDLLRLNCNEDEFLGALNAKAQVQNKRIIIFIDAINEGKGRSFWNEFLIGFIESIKRYEWLGLVLSIRSSYFDLIVPKEVFESSSAIPITHFGFDGVEYNASKLFFKNYNILQPSIPLLHPEFSNPLFLKLFCEGLSKKGLTHIPDGYEGISNIIKFFIEGIEQKLSKKYPNIKSLQSIDKAIKVLIPKILENQTIPYDDALAIFVQELTSNYGISTDFLDDLIDEGLLIKNLFYDYDKSEHVEGVYFVYERFEDHLKVKYLFDNYLDKDEPKKSFEENPLSGYFEAKKIYYNQGIIDAMSIQLPEICNLELADVIPQNKIIIDSFFNGLLWRKVESITPNVVDRLLKNISNEHFQEKIFKVLFSTASNPINPLNSNLLFEYLSQFTMKERDIFLIPLLNSIYLNYDINPINRLIDWAWSDEDKNYISDDSMLLTSLALSWFLTSSNRQLRDYATKALISILQGRVFVVLELLKKFENINEPYIYERLYAVAFGVVVKVEDYNGLKEIGEYIYKTIFNKDEVYPHILLRDYAKNTIEYIAYLGIELNIELDKIKPPYKSYLPKIEELPTNEDIEKYQDRDNEYHQSHIISSMITEYGNGTGGYGDFGRYVFGSALSDFEFKKDEQLFSNYATLKIFEEYGYDGVFFKKAEKNISEANRNDYGRYNHTIERIGKKYQWMAFYDTLARVTDNCKMYEGYGEDRQEVEYVGSFEPYVRDIDPTVLLKKTQLDRKSDATFWWNPECDIDWNMDNKEWVKSADDLIDSKSILDVIDEDGNSWTVLSSFPDWDEPLKKGYDRSETIHKSLWYQFRSYLVPKKELNEFTQWANKQNFWGNWMPSESNTYQMFNREYYWSKAYDFFQSPYYERSEEWTNLKHGYPNKVALTTDVYYWEEEHDYSKEGTLNILKPSKIIFDGLEMKYANKDGQYRDKDGNLICFEASVENRTHQCLLVNKEKLLKFLDDNDLTICWALIGEKRVLTPGFGGKDFIGLLEVSSYTYLKDAKLVNGSVKLMQMDSDHKKIYIEISPIEEE